VVSAAIPFAHFTLSSAADVSATFMNLQKKWKWAKLVESILEI
jgi:hypothetical protein